MLKTRRLFILQRTRGLHLDFGIVVPVTWPF